MAKQHERTAKPIKREVEERSDNVLAIVSVVGLVACVLINGIYKDSVPEFVFWVLGLSITKDALKLVRIASK